MADGKTASGQIDCSWDNPPSAGPDNKFDSMNPNVDAAHDHDIGLHADGCKGCNPDRVGTALEGKPFLPYV